MVGASEADTMRGNEEVSLLACEVPQLPLAVHERHRGTLSAQFLRMDLAVQPPNTFTLDGQAVKDGFCSARRNARMSEEIKLKQVIRQNIKELNRVGVRLNALRQNLATVKNSLTASIDLSVSLDPLPPCGQPAAATTDGECVVAVPVGIPIAIPVS